jgi:tetratricopeptide (TPR) repeat protein
MAELTIYDKYAKDGDAAMNAGNYREAEACWHTAMKIAEYFGEHDPRLIESMEKLASVYSQMERNREAAGLIDTAGKIRTRITGVNFPAQGPNSQNTSRAY